MREKVIRKYASNFYLKELRNKEHEVPEHLLGECEKHGLIVDPEKNCLPDKCIWGNLCQYLIKKLK